MRLVTAQLPEKFGSSDLCTTNFAQTEFYGVRPSGADPSTTSFWPPLPKGRVLGHQVSDRRNSNERGSDTSSGRGEPGVHDANRRRDGDRSGSVGVDRQRDG